MKILSVDTTHGDCSVSLLHNEKIEASITQTESGKQAEQMISIIEDVLQEGRLDYKDLDAIGVNIGPGSFTGVRIGLAGVKGIALVTKTPIIPITSFESVIRQLHLNNNEHNILVVLDAKRNQLYTQLFNPDMKALNEPELLDYKDITKFDSEGKIILTGNGSPLVSQILSDIKCDYKILNENAVSESRSIAFAANEKLKENNYPDIVAPLYIRKPDAKKQIN